MIFLLAQESTIYIQPNGLIANLCDVPSKFLT